MRFMMLKLSFMVQALSLVGQFPSLESICRCFSSDGQLIVAAIVRQRLTACRILARGCLWSERALTMRWSVMSCRGWHPRRLSAGTSAAFVVAHTVTPQRKPHVGYSPHVGGGAIELGVDPEDP